MPTQRLPDRGELQLSDRQAYVARRAGLSAVMVDTLARVKAGTHTYPTRVAPLVRRGLVTRDGRRLTKSGHVLADALNLPETTAL